MHKRQDGRFATGLKRILLKLSGQALTGSSNSNFDSETLERIAREINLVHSKGVEIAVVVGGGNIFRGRDSKDLHIDREEADLIGVMGTVMNGILLRSFLMKAGAPTKHLSALADQQFTETYTRSKALQYMNQGEIVILSGGIGQPYLTTDYPAVQRAIELRCDVVLAAKHGLDGVYDKDPNKYPDAEKYIRIPYADVISNNLGFMDLSSIVLARDHNVPIFVFNFDKTGSILSVVNGGNPGTLVDNGM